MSFYFTEPDYARDGMGAKLTGRRRFEADVEVLHDEIRRGRANEAGWSARRAMRSARKCGLLEWSLPHGADPEPVQDEALVLAAAMADKAGR